MSICYEEATSICTQKTVCYMLNLFSGGSQKLLLSAMNISSRKPQTSMLREDAEEAQSNTQPPYPNTQHPTPNPQTPNPKSQHPTPTPKTNTCHDFIALRQDPCLAG